jgi:hypothetical protein
VTWENRWDRERLRSKLSRTLRFFSIFMIKCLSWNPSFTTENYWIIRCLPSNSLVGEFFFFYWNTRITSVFCQPYGALSEEKGKRKIKLFSNFHSLWHRLPFYVVFYTERLSITSIIHLKCFSLYSQFRWNVCFGKFWII